MESGLVMEYDVGKKLEVIISLLVEIRDLLAEEEVDEGIDEDVDEDVDKEEHANHIYKEAPEGRLPKEDFNKVKRVVTPERTTNLKPVQLKEVREEDDDLRELEDLVEES